MIRPYKNHARKHVSSACWFGNEPSRRFRYLTTLSVWWLSCVVQSRWRGRMVVTDGWEQGKGSLECCKSHDIENLFGSPAVEWKRQVYKHHFNAPLCLSPIFPVVSSIHKQRFGWRYDWQVIKTDLPRLLPRVSFPQFPPASICFIWPSVTATVTWTPFSRVWKRKLRQELLHYALIWRWIAVF